MGALDAVRASFLNQQRTVPGKYEEKEKSGEGGGSTGFKYPRGGGDGGKRAGLEQLTSTSAGSTGILNFSLNFRGTHLTTMLTATSETSL